MNKDIMLQKIIDKDRLCDVCRYNMIYNCHGGVRGGPNGPIYPPCADGDLERFVDENLIEDVYEELVEEEMIMIKKVGFYNPVTVVFWEDGTKTVVKAEGEAYDKEKGLAMAIAKKYFGNTGSYWNVFKKWVGENKDE